MWWNRAEPSRLGTYQIEVLNRVGADKQKSTEADDQLYVKKAGGG